MELSFLVSQCPSLDSLYCRNVELTFNQPLEDLEKSLHPLMVDLKNKGLAKCFLVPLEEAIPEPKYQAVLLGGTFDYFHIGHQLLLLTAIFLADKRILIGISGESLLSKKKNKQFMQPIQIRTKQLEKYIKKIKPNLIVEIEEINDPFGPAIVRADFDAIAVSIETRTGADKINQIRKQRNLKLLQVQICPLMSLTSQIDLKISSSHAREYILQKNKLTTQQFIDYKQKWLDLNTKIATYFKFDPKIEHTQQWWDRILQQYSEYWRFYHTNAHILSMLQEFQEAQAKHIFPELTQLEIIAVKVAIWFHDVEYLPPAKNNQQASAELSKKYLSGLLGNLVQAAQASQLIKLVYDSIMQTKYHKPKDLVSKVLSDLDMSILDSEQNKYKEYAQGIRKQYQPIAKNLYNEKRLQFLQSLKIEGIFYYGEHNRVKNNIQWEVEMLKSKKKQQL